MLLFLRFLHGCCEVLRAGCTLAGVDQHGLAIFDFSLCQGLVEAGKADRRRSFSFSSQLG